MTKMPCQLVIIEQINVHIAAINNAVTITCLRPIASDNGPVNINPTASNPVETESDRLLLAGEIPKSCDNTGRIG